MEYGVNKVCPNCSKRKGTGNTFRATGLDNVVTGKCKNCNYEITEKTFEHTIKDNDGKEEITVTEIYRIEKNKLGSTKNTSK